HSSFQVAAAAFPLPLQCGSLRAGGEAERVQLEEMGAGESQLVGGKRAPCPVPICHLVTISTYAAFSSLTLKSWRLPSLRPAIPNCSRICSSLWPGPSMALALSLAACPSDQDDGRPLPLWKSKQRALRGFLALWPWDG
ncbi:hypothetical protein MC885_016761, partial [Smutsia gigantea]